MSLDPLFIDWQDPPFPASGLSPLRLAVADHGLALYRATVEPASSAEFQRSGRGYRSVLVPISIAGGSAPEIAVAQRFAMVPAFDIAALGGGTYALAMESFRGGSYGLLVGESAQGAFTVGANYQDVTDYRFPRFVRGDARAGRLVTAVTDGTALSALTGKPLPPRDWIGKQAPFEALAVADSGVVVATTPPNGMLASAALFAKQPVADSQPLASGDFPGTLTLSHLLQGKRSGGAQILFGTGATYSFDVDVQSGIALVLGSTRKGPQLISCDLASGKTTDIAWPQGYPATGTWIAYPTVLAVAAAAGSSVFSIAFHESVGNDPKGIRYGQLDLATLR